MVSKKDLADVSSLHFDSTNPPNLQAAYIRKRRVIPIVSVAPMGFIDQPVEKTFRQADKLFETSKKFQKVV